MSLCQIGCKGLCHVVAQSSGGTPFAVVGLLRPCGHWPGVSGPCRSGTLPEIILHGTLLRTASKSRQPGFVTFIKDPTARRKAG